MDEPVLFGQKGERGADDIPAKGGVIAPPTAKSPVLQNHFESIFFGNVPEVDDRERYPGGNDNKTEEYPDDAYRVLPEQL
jgi:hypothetical protein